MIVQIALSLVLLVAAALFVRTLANLQHQALGVDDERILVFGVDGSQNGYEGQRLSNLYQTLLHRFDGAPGVEHATVARLRLFSGWIGGFAASFLYGLTPRDPSTFGASAAALVAVASLAGFIPARRASLVDPGRALKAD